MIAGNDIANGCASSLTDRLFPLAEPRQKRAAGGIGKRSKGAVQRLVLILNHTV
ncbi:hypothetical protein [Bradyrhizobium sp. JR3.5]